MDTTLIALKDTIERESIHFKALQEEIGKVIVGQQQVVERVLVGLLADGHLLLEGVPGLAKTLTFKTLAAAVSARFQRLQFTPDLLPADLIGTQVYHPQRGEFSTRQGPIFANLVLADEINRAPAKVQSALLEAMQERQVTIGDHTYALPDPFLVMATQNPIEQEGTYPLPEAQVDRFMLKIRIDYPTRQEESSIIDRMTGGHEPHAKPCISPEDLLRVRSLVPQVYLDDKVKNYILDLVFATRAPEKFRLEKLKPLIAYGASPRASIALAQASRAYAFLRGRAYVTPDDVKSIGFDVLRHRVMPSYEAEAEEVNAEALLRMLFDGIQVP
ncbi:MAG: MoxR family ATPase [Armatimonadetes bacterium]|nr:MoxR family ATPase [Armatimonadota bacterium]